MNTATYQTTESLSHYFANLSRAARAFAAALFAAQERQYAAQEVAPSNTVSARTLQKTRMQLFAMARNCEDMAPSLASELRYLAARG